MDAPGEDPRFSGRNDVLGKNEGDRADPALGARMGRLSNQPLAGDGTVLHAVDRLFGVVASQGG